MDVGKTLDELLAEDLQEPEFRAAWEACAVGRALGLWLIRYRTDRNFEFDELAAQLGLDFDGLAELEAGDEDPPTATLLWLSRTLGTPIGLQVERGAPGTATERLVIDATAAKAA
jgi:transcriptional regulator with XRE-family HTH domain